MTGKSICVQDVLYLAGGSGQCSIFRNITAYVWGSLAGVGCAGSPSEKKPLLTHGSPFVVPRTPCCTRFFQHGCNRKKKRKNWRGREEYYCSTNIHTKESYSCSRTWQSHDNQCRVICGGTILDWRAAMLSQICTAR